MKSETNSPPVGRELPPLPIIGRPNFYGFASLLPTFRQCGGADHRTAAFGSHLSNKPAIQQSISLQSILPASRHSALRGGGSFCQKCPHLGCLGYLLFKNGNV